MAFSLEIEAQLSQKKSVAIPNLFWIPTALANRPFLSCFYIHC